MTGSTVPPRPSQHIRDLPAPLSELPWSADFVMQAIEVLVVTLGPGGRPVALRPDCADSFVVGWPAGAKPEVVAAEALQRLGLEARVLHSTSWRHSGAEVVLTYLGVVSAGTAPPASWLAVPIAHAELAARRGHRPAAGHRRASGAGARPAAPGVVGAR